MSAPIDTQTTMGDQYHEMLEKLKDAQNVKEQISVVREVCASLKTSQGDITHVLKSLVEIYFTFPTKHQIKKVLISAFQNLPSQSCKFIVQELTYQLDCCKTQYVEKTSVDLRKYINTIAELLDNFPLGETCIENRCIDVLQTISQILFKFLTENRSTQSSVKQNELMHNCLTGIQAVNRILQKCATTLSSKGREEINMITSKLLKHDIEILHTDEFLMDCKTTCAINVILLIRLQYPDTVLSKVVKYIFEETELTDNDDDFIKLSKGGNHTCKMCLLYGIMSILELSELVEELHDEQCLLLDYLFVYIQQITSEGFTDSINKLLSVKCYNMWTAKCLSSMKSGLMSDKQKELLQGNGQIIQTVMSFVWTVWEDTTDVIRIIAREIFENVLQIHTMASLSDTSTDPFLQSLTKKLLFEVSWSSKGKYGMMCMLVQILGTSQILQHAPNLSATILSQMSEHALACHASELYIQLCIKHQTESQDTWMLVWIDPLLTVLAGQDKQQINNVIEYILTKLLKRCKDLLQYILEKLSSHTDSTQMSSLVMCLRRARMMGLLDKQLESAQNVNDFINLSLLQQALCHIEEQVRLDAFAFVCESHKTTAVINDWELELIKQFLPWNLNSQSPAFRQQMLSHLKKLLSRMKESETVIFRQLKKSTGIQSQTYRDNLEQYNIFLSWLTRHLLSCLYPGSSFARRTTCLNALTLLVDIFGTPSRGFTVNDKLIGSDFNTMVDCLTDTFEDNKIESYKLLKYCPDLPFMKQSFDSVDSLFETALGLAGSTRPQDSTTAAYLFKVLLLQTEFYTVMLMSRSSITSCQPSLSETPDSQLEEDRCVQDLFPRIPDSQSGRVLYLLFWLLHYLKNQIKMAKKSLMTAACTKPLYPTLHSIRYVMQDVSYRSIPALDITHWKEFVTGLLESCLLISEIVSPVVQNSSPEGNIPQEAIGDLKEKFEDMAIMPEYLTVCCWRSIKEVSLLLGQICTTVPIVDPSKSEFPGLLTCSQIDKIGLYFKVQLLESIHRGAFELAYAGFVKMCDMLWRSSIEELYKLPKIWLSHLMTEIQSVSSKLCATRRSAGVPFYVQALVTTEPVTTGRQCFKQAMSDLLKLALTAESLEMSESKVHSLNILRAMYRDTRLGEDVTPFVSGGLQAAILGFKSKFWAVCNSSTLLFSALMTRIFGVKRSKDESNISKKNCQTGKAFFHKYPGLYNFMLDLLAEATENVGQSGTVHIHPALYPLLMVLARLFPSPLEGTDTSLNLSAFIPYIIRCSSSAVLKTRQMSAKSLQPLVGGSNIVTVVTDLLLKIPVHRENVHFSQLHGVLLQINSILEIIPSLDVNIRNLVLQVLITEWIKRRWLLSKLCSCFIVRKEVVKLTSCLLTELSEDTNQNTKFLQNMFLKFLDEEQQLLTESYRQAGPGYIEYLSSLSNFLLIYCDKGVNSSEQCDRGDKSLQYCDRGDNCAESRLILMLDCCHYEVRIIGLVYLYGISTDEELGEDLVFNDVIKTAERSLSTKILSSSKVLKKLIQMLTKETYFECQRLLFKALKHHPLVRNNTWFDDEKQLVQIFKHGIDFIESCSRDELRAEMLQLTGFLVKPLLECVLKGESSLSGGIQKLLIEWKDILYQNKETEKHCLLQLSVIKVLYNNTDILLKDSTKFWGEMVFTFWDILVNLLQEDDDEVKIIAAKVVSQINPDVQVTAHPFLALDLTVSAMLKYHSKNMWMPCLETLLKWADITLDNETGEEGRLFDKNEMNTWREDVQFVKIVTKYIIHIILKFDNSLTLSKEHPVCSDSANNKDNSDSLTETLPGSQRFNREKLELLYSNYTEQFCTNQQLALEPCPVDDWTHFCQILHRHLSSNLEKCKDSPSSPFKDVNKHIQTSINNFKLDSILQVCKCMYDKDICNLVNKTKL